MACEVGEGRKSEMKHLQLQKQVEEFQQLFTSKSLKKIQVVWDDSLKLNPQKKINIVITVSEADSIFG